MYRNPLFTFMSFRLLSDTLEPWTQTTNRAKLLASNRVKPDPLPFFAEVGPACGDYCGDRGISYLVSEPDPHFSRVWFRDYHLPAQATVIESPENASIDGGSGPHSGERIGPRSFASFAAELQPQLREVQHVQEGRLGGQEYSRLLLRQAPSSGNLHSKWEYWRSVQQVLVEVG